MEYKKTLQDLIKLHCFIKDKKIFAEIYFRGEGEPAFIVDCGIIFGDIIGSSIIIFEHPYPWRVKEIKQIPNITMEKVEEILEYYNKEIYAKFEYNKRPVLEYKDDSIDDLYNILIECWNDLSLVDYNTFEFIHEVLNYCEEQDDVLTYDLLNYLIEKLGFEIPVHDNVIVQLNQENIVTNMFITEAEEENVKDEIIKYTRMYNLPRKTLYEVDTLPDLLLAMLIEITKNNKRLKRCSHCGKWFIPIKSDEKYCPRINDGISCKQSAAKKVRQETNQKKPHSKMYNNINTNLASHRDNAKTDEEYEVREQRLLVFRAEAVEWKKQIKQGNKTENEYEQWLANYLKK